MVNILSFQSEKFWVNIFALQSAKLQMFDDQSYHVWHPIKACFGVMCSHLDASDGMQLHNNQLYEIQTTISTAH